MTRHGLRLRALLVPAMTALSLAAVFPGCAGAQISPGPLARPHAEFEGATNCARCHGLRREPMAQLCLGCHKEVQWAMDRQRGLHAREAGAGRKACASCHPDHAGAGFALVAWDEGSAERFDHRRTGWPLEAKHQAAPCEKCHTQKFRVSPAAALSSRKAGAGWMGLEAPCASCHRDDDVHTGSLGATCDKCHDARGWTPAPRFDHAATDYPLTGRHGEVTCDKCHRAARLGGTSDARGQRPPVFKPVPFRECSSCHDDPHRGRLSPKCGQCHVTRGFGVIERKDFNHALTRYPLEGRHRTVRCEGCHGDRLSNPNPPYVACASCHADVHKGEATMAGRAVDCAACHRAQGFAPSTFTVAQHAESRFPLGGRHSQVRCASCHPAVRLATARIRVPFGRCGDCHADAHGAQLAKRVGWGTCEACHRDTGWKPSAFTVASHAALRLPLEGRHGEIACAACHGTARAGIPTPATFAAAAGPAKFVFALAETGCAACHGDPHAGRYAPGGARPTAGGCAACHGAVKFRPSTLDVALHAHFTFALDGAHRAAPCTACHEEMRRAPAARTLLRDASGLAALPFTATRATTCGSCHQTPHGSQFAARKDAGACEACHATAAFAPASRFDHDRDAAFSLNGAHGRVPCTSCHRPVATAGTMVVRYRGVPTACEGCHAGRPGRERA